MKDIKLFGFEGCPYCKKMQDLLNGENIPFNYIDIDDEKNESLVDEILTKNDIDSVPVVVVGNTILAPDSSFDTIEEGFQLIKRFLGV